MCEKNARELEASIVAEVAARTERRLGLSCLARAAKVARARRARISSTLLSPVLVLDPPGAWNAAVLGARQCIGLRSCSIGLAVTRRARD